MPGRMGPIDASMDASYQSYDQKSITIKVAGTSSKAQFAATTLSPNPPNALMATTIIVSPLVKERKNEADLKVSGRSANSLTSLIDVDPGGVEGALEGLGRTALQACDAR